MTKDKRGFARPKIHGLFKILITNFPCQPENEATPEEVLDLNFSPREDLFSKEELLTLSRWVEKHSDVLNQDGFNEGSLFFLKLGEGKRGHIEDKNLEEGIRFSFSILNELARKRKDAERNRKGDCE